MGNYLQKAIFGDREVRVLMLGLDNGGKTTILYKLKLGEIVTTIPTIGFNVETITHNDFSLVTWDVGCRDKMRPLVRHYFKNTDALIFVIDSHDRMRYEEAVDDFLKMVCDSEDLRCVPVLILANKQDFEDIMSVEEINKDLEKRNFLHQHSWAVFGVCGRTGNGLQEALDWLTGSLAHLYYKEGCLRNFMQNPSNRKTSRDVVKHSRNERNLETKDTVSSSNENTYIHYLKSIFKYGK